MADDATQMLAIRVLSREGVTWQVSNARVASCRLTCCITASGDGEAAEAGGVNGSENRYVRRPPLESAR